MNPKAKKIVDIAIYVLVGIIFIFAIFSMIMSLSARKNNNIPQLFGKMAVSVLSDSMDGKVKNDAFYDGSGGSFKKGDMILVDKYTHTQGQTLRVGTVITYRFTKEMGRPQELNTHRIIEVVTTPSGFYYRTQGDKAGLPPDQSEESGVGIEPDEVVGVYMGSKIPGLGAVVQFMKSSLGFGLVVVLPLFLFFGYQLFNVIKVIIAINKEKKQGAPAGADDAVLKELEELRAKVASMNNNQSSPGDKQS